MIAHFSAYHTLHMSNGRNLQRLCVELVVSLELPWITIIHVSHIKLGSINRMVSWGYLWISLLEVTPIIASIFGLTCQECLSPEAEAQGVVFWCWTVTPCQTCLHPERAHQISSHLWRGWIMLTIDLRFVEKDVCVTSHSHFVLVIRYFPISNLSYKQTTQRK